MSPARRHHGPHLPGHGPVLAGLREQRGGLQGAHWPARNHQPPLAGKQHACHPAIVPPRAPVRPDAEPVSPPPGLGGGGGRCHHPEGPLLQPLMGPARRVFAECHSLIPPGPYFNACVSDSCWPGRGRAVLCQSLEAYAELCRSRGVCPDWRNATHGLCGELGMAAGGPGLLGPLDICLYAPRPCLPTHQGVQVVWPRAAGVLRLQVSPADRERAAGTAGLPGRPGGPGGEPGGDLRGSRTPAPDLGGALPPPDLPPQTRG